MGVRGPLPHSCTALQADGNEGFSSFDLLQTYRRAGMSSSRTTAQGGRRRELPQLLLDLALRVPAAVQPALGEDSQARAGLPHDLDRLRGPAGRGREGEASGRPALLTEHGIYTKERRIEINRSDWIQDWDSGELVAERKAPYFRRYWIRQFEMMSRITYEYGDEVLTLYDGNTLEQIKDGCDPRKIRVIPNGIDLTRFGESAKAFDERPPQDRFTVCFVGRVCPIKDVITFISAMRLVADEVPNLRVRVMGPMDEDPEYAEMCQRHARQLGLENNLVFEGKVNVLEELPTVDVMVLTSISEAQPLVILEAGAVGIPTVATNVGSCNELLYGMSPEDRVLGSGGIVTPMASPGETAKAILTLYREPKQRERMRDTMRERVRRFYDQRDMVASYDELYTRWSRACARRRGGRGAAGTGKQGRAGQGRGGELMAGIGFELRRMIDQREGFVAKVRAYACAGLISSGPWLMTILTLTLLNLAGPVMGGTKGYALFRALVTYAFAFSLIFTGVGQMAVTRRIADLLYSQQYDRVLPAFASTLLITGLAHGAIAAGFCYWAGFSITLSFLVMALFAIIGMTWISLIWLSVARQYDEVLRAYIYGTLIAMIGVLVLVVFKGTAGILTAYTAGQAYTLVMLIKTITRGMESGGGRDFSVLTSLTGFPKLVAVGLFYNAAIWVDKMIFWFRDGVGPHPLVRYHPLYDTCSFLAYMTVVPALAVNLIRLETSFYEHYRAYYGAILGGTPLSVIDDKRERMLRNLNESVVRLLRVQGAITIVVILFSPVIIDFLELRRSACGSSA